MKPRNIKIYKVKNPNMACFFSNFIPDYLILFPTYGLTFSDISEKKDCRLTILSLYGFKSDGEIKQHSQDFLLTEDEDLRKICSHLQAGLELCAAKEIELEELPEDIYKLIQEKLEKHKNMLKNPSIFDILGGLKCPQE